MKSISMCTGMCMWCMGMFGARFAVFVRRARVLSSSMQLIIFVLDYTSVKILSSGLQFTRTCTHTCTTGVHVVHIHMYMYTRVTCKRKRTCFIVTANYLIIF